MIYEYGVLLFPVTSCRDHLRELRHLCRFRDAISQTCSHWRSVALQTPSLWSTIASRPDTERRIVPAIPLTELEVQRSGSLSLSFYLHAWEQYHLDMLACIILPVLHRSRFMYESIVAIKYGNRDDGHVTQSVLRGGVAALQLQSLVVLYSGDDDDDYPAFSNLHLSETPALRDLWVQDNLWPRDSVSIQLPHAGNCIARLRLGGWIHSRVAVGLINSCQQLETLFWSSFNLDDQLLALIQEQEPYPTPDILTLPRLLNLALVDNYLIFHTSSFNAPNLVRLRIGLDVEDYERWIDLNSPGSLPFINPQQFPKLRFLDVGESIDPPNVFNEFICAHPDLEEIVLRGTSLKGADGFVKTLSGTSPLLPGVPKLQRLWLQPTVRRHKLSIVKIRDILHARETQTVGPFDVFLDNRNMPKRGEDGAINGSSLVLPNCHRVRFSAARYDEPVWNWTDLEGDEHVDKI